MVRGDVGAFAGGNSVAGSVQQLNAHFAFAVVPGGNLNAGICALHSGGDADAGAAEVIQGEVVLADHHQADIAVDAAIEGEVSFLGGKRGRFCCCRLPRSARFHPAAVR